MTRSRLRPLRWVLCLLLTAGCAHGEAKRLIVIKVDGLGQDTLARWIGERNPQTGKSFLPWIDHVFVQRGTRLKNFYVREISLSAPSWSMLDSGWPSVIHGNAEWDRVTGHVYDYLNFFPFYFYNARNARADMPAVEVLDESGIPLLIDSYKPAERLQSMQLFQRDVRWETLKSTLPLRFGSRSVRELFDEWQTGFELTQAVGEQVERELLAAIAQNRILYLDYFFGDYDHVAHLQNDEASERRVLEKLDALVGRIWTAIEASPLPDDTALVLLSDHGMNTAPEVYSQGYDLVKFFGSQEAGGHHVETNRYPLTDYKIRGMNIFVSRVITPSRDSLYLRDQPGYPTATLDLDGNERAAVYLRNSDLNKMQLLLKQMAAQPAESRLPAALQFIAIVDQHRTGWTRTADEIQAEVAALDRAVARRRSALPPRPNKQTPEQRAAHYSSHWRRMKTEADSWERQARRYSVYLDWLRTILKLEPADLVNRKFSETVLVPPRFSGGPNTTYQLQNYVVNRKDGTFETVNYFELLTAARVRNNVQNGVDPHPVDFIATRLPDGSVWLYAAGGRQALIQTRDDGHLLRYLPVRDLRQNAAGEITYDQIPLAPGLPLRYFEDAGLDVPGGRAEWLSGWHTDREWLQATHRTHYSDGLIALAEHFAPVRIGESSSLWEGAGADAPILRRFALRLRNMVSSDLLLLANDHWNFNVRGFNPGGNHGSFFRVSTHSVLMLAGAGVPPGLSIERPYDTLSVVPTLMSLTGRGDPSNYPGPVIGELFRPTEVPRP